MREPTPSFETDLGRVREAYRQAVQEGRRQQEALASLQRLLTELSEENLRLHRRTLAILETLNRDVERFKRLLKRLNTART